MKWPKFDPFDLVWPQYLTNDYLVSYRQGVTHAYLPPKFQKISIKIVIGREVTRIVLRRGRGRSRRKQGWIQSIHFSGYNKGIADYILVTTNFRLLCFMSYGVQILNLNFKLIISATAKYTDYSYTIYSTVQNW